MITILFVSIAVLALGLGLIAGILLWKQKVIKYDYNLRLDAIYDKLSERDKSFIRHYDAKLLELKEEFNLNSPKEVSHLIEKALTELKKELMIIASTSLVNGEPFLVPDCVIEAHEKGYLTKGFEFELGGTVYKFCDIQLASDKELIITTEKISKALFGQTKHAPITIYKDGLWLELKPVTEKKSLRDINIK